MDELRLLLDLVEVPSPSGDEGAACDVFLARATRLGFRAERDAVGNVIATIGSGGPHTMFLGHIDTVPGFWPVRFESGSLSGRGVVDAKGALAAALLAAARLGLDGPGTRTVVAAVGEETDSRGAQHLLRCDPPAARNGPFAHRRAGAPNRCGRRHNGSGRDQRERAPGRAREQVNERRHGRIVPERNRAPAPRDRHPIPERISAMRKGKKTPRTACAARGASADARCRLCGGVVLLLLRRRLRMQLRVGAVRRRLGIADVHRQSHVGKH